MALSNLKIHQISREKLYFNRYSFKGVIEAAHLYYAYNVNDIGSFKRAVSRATKWNYGRIDRIIEDDIDYPLIKKIIEFKKKSKGNIVTFRHEGDKMSVFTNEHSILEEVHDIYPDVAITHIQLNPAGIKYFKNDPPAKYRLYLKSHRIDSDGINSLLNFFDNSGNLVKPCRSLKYMVTSNRYKSRFIRTTQFIDYSEESTLSYIGLMFPGIIGEIYKLEKK